MLFAGVSGTEQLVNLLVCLIEPADWPKKRKSKEHGNMLTLVLATTLSFKEIEMWPWRWGGAESCPQVYGAWSALFENYELIIFKNSEISCKNTD